MRTTLENTRSCCVVGCRGFVELLKGILETRLSLRSGEMRCEGRMELSRVGDKLWNIRVGLGDGRPALFMQPPATKLCGHVCVCTLTGKSLEHIVKLIGHQRGTRTQDLVAALRGCGLSCDDRLRRVRGGRVPVGARGIASVRWSRKDEPSRLVPGGHWVVAWDGELLDPQYGVRSPTLGYGFGPKMRVTSMLHVRDISVGSGRD